MRDPKRISKIIKLLEEAWNIAPDLRLGQLVEILHSRSKYPGDLFNIEDDVTEKTLTKFIEENK